MQSKPARPSRGMTLPTFGADSDGAVIPHAGRYARECVLTAFEMIGGVDRMAAWADENPTDFFTKLYPKVITKEVEIQASEGVEELLLRLDRADRSAGPTLEADFEIVEDDE